MNRAKHIVRLISIAAFLLSVISLTGCSEVVKTYELDSSQSLSWVTYSTCSEWESTPIEYADGPAASFIVDSSKDLKINIAIDTKESSYICRSPTSIESNSPTGGKHKETLEYVQVDKYAGAVCKCSSGEAFCRTATPYGILWITCTYDHTKGDQSQALSLVKQVASSIVLDQTLFADPPSREYIEDSFKSDAPRYPYEEAINHIGEIAVVYGAVSDVYYAEESKGQPTFIDFGDPESENSFTAVIWGENRVKLEFSLLLKCPYACKYGIYGEIVSYTNNYGVTIPEIVLTDDDQYTSMIRPIYYSSLSIDDLNQKISEKNAEKKKEAEDRADMEAAKRPF